MPPSDRRSAISELPGPRKSASDSPPDALFPLVYAELRQRAERLLRGERTGHTLQPTALVHEAWLRLEGEWQGERGHYLALAATAMRRVLVDAARRRRAQKRGGDGPQIELGDLAETPRASGLVALDDALHELAEHDAELERLVELRFFGGMTHPEIAEELGVPLRRVERRWALARAFLNRALERVP